MKLCIPIEQVKGLESSVYSHFGSAPAFLIFDTNSKEEIIIDNSNMNHDHGACNPIQTIGGSNVDTVIVGSIGGGAISKLKANNIKVFQSVKGTVEFNIEMFNKSLLTELTMEHACTQHHHNAT
jgi:predicted Fe-Mo cluster-binding NifX family protein